MRELLRKILRPKYEPLNRLEISAANLLANYELLKSLQPSAAIFPVLKSNAYGHGLKEVCSILNRSDAPLVAVDSYPEAQIAYRYFHKKILILGEMPLAAYDYCRFTRTEFVVYNAATLQYLSRYGKKAKLHLFVNSGMNREGIKDLAVFLKEQKNNLDKVDIVGLCSHLAAGDEESNLNREQETKFLADLALLRSAGFAPRWIHLGNSAAVFTPHDKSLTAFRPGLAFYGYNPFPAASALAPLAAGLKPALSAFSRLVSTQDIRPGEIVSYGATYRANQAVRIGLIPFGYFEGLDRRLSNKAQLLVRGRKEEFMAQIAGRVCMNLSCLDLGSHEAAVGDTVQIISPRPSAPNSIASLAALMDTIPYEVLVKLQPNIRRDVIN